MQRADEEATIKALRRAESTGRPLDDESFVARREAMIGRPLRPQKRGPKQKNKG